MMGINKCKFAFPFPTTSVYPNINCSRTQSILATQTHHISPQKSGSDKRLIYVTSFSNQLFTVFRKGGKKTQTNPKPTTGL